MNAEWVTPAGDWPAGVRALTTTRRWPEGVDSGGPVGGPVGAPATGEAVDGWNLADHVGDAAPRVAAGRRALGALTGVRQVQWLAQVHGTRCLAATSATAATAPQADAAWTAERGLGLAVLTADCVPVVVCDRAATVVGVAHGGWRGLVAGVVDSLVAALPAAADLVAWLGPAIGPRAYEVGDEVAAAVTALADGERLAAACLRPAAAGRHYLDLFTLSERLLERAGVTAVSTERLCTFADARFFSYRRDGRTGRMATLAWLE